MIEDQGPVPPPEPTGKTERSPFWGYADILLLAGLALPCMFLGWAAVHVAMWLTHLHTTAQGLEAVPEMVIGYGLLFGAMTLIFRVQYERPLWRSLGWAPAGIPAAWCILAGFGTLLAVSLIAYLLHTPPAAGPLVEMLNNPRARILLAIFGTTVAPLAEELLFRGFLQPLLVRDLGAVAGISLAAALFGGLHYSEYGDSWRSALQVALAGAAFGSMRQMTGSTKAAAIMHAAYNGLPFLWLFTAGGGGRL